MYINVDIDNNNFYFSIVLHVHAKLMKYMIYKNNWNHKNNIHVVFFAFYDLLKSIFLFLTTSKSKRTNTF